MTMPFLLLSLAAEVLKARKFEQVPQLEGRASQFEAPLFSV